MEAAKCLGELGPADLTTLVLQPENNFYTLQKEDNPLNKLLKLSITTLTDLIISDSVKEKKVAVAALYAILSTGEGNHILQDKSSGIENVAYLTPFRNQGQLPANLTIRVNQFVSNIDREELWIPSDHETWIINLVKSILGSCAESSNIVTAFNNLSEINSQFAQKIFPLLLDYILLAKNKTCNDVINRNINCFFSNFFEDVKSQNPNQTSVQCMVDVVDYIRIERNCAGIYK